MDAPSAPALEAAFEIFPIGTRVRIRDTGAYGTVKSWGFFTGMVYTVAEDSGRRIVAPGSSLERARPHRQWFLDAIVIETLP